MAIDYINTLGAGAGFNTKEIVSALVEAETSVSKTRIESKIEDNDTQISALATAAASMVALQDAAKKLNDATDFNTYSTSNSQTTAFSVTAGSTASAGSHNVTVSAVAREQRTNITPNGASEFTSASQLLNSGSAFDIDITIGDTSTVTTTVNVTTATPQGIVDAINAANIDVSAQLIDKGTSGSNYIIQLVGKSGTDQQFSITPSVNSLLAADTPSGEAAANAAVSVNGVTYSRSSNSIDDIIPGVTLALNGVTSGAASVSITQDTSTIKSNIENLVTQFNATKSALKDLSDRESDGALSGDSIFRGHIRDMQNFFTAFSSTPGGTIRGLSDMGISITKTGALEVSDAKLDSAIASNLADIKKVFSADTTNQSEIGAADRGIAGDLSYFVSELNKSTGYFKTTPASLTDKNSKLSEELVEIEAKVESLTERYNRQFAQMNAIIDEMNNTKDNLISSFENLPFTKKN